MSEQDSDSDSKRPVIDTKTVIMTLIGIILAFCAWWAKGMDSKVGENTERLIRIEAHLGTRQDSTTCEN